MAVVPDLEWLISGSRRALAKSITLIESKRAQDREAAVSLIESALPHSGNSLRVGISGVPGVGKSTFIESQCSRWIPVRRLPVAASLATKPGCLTCHGPRMHLSDLHPHPG